MSNFLPYTDKSTLDQKYSRYILGGTSDSKPNFVGYWDKLEFPTNQIDDIQVTVTKEWEFRGDLIAYNYYGNTNLEWVILQYNNIIDVNEELTAGTIITIPSVQRVMLSIVTQPQTPNDLTTNSTN